MVKVTLTFEGDEQAPKTSLKMDLPVKWMDGPLSRVVDTFCTHFNKKNAQELKPSELHVVSAAGNAVIPMDASVGMVTSQLGHDFLIRRGPTPSVTTKAEEEEEEEDVTTKAGLERVQKKTHAFDYSKWDRLDLSDDDGADCHPNIELASWKRIKAQQRAERRQKEAEEVKRLTAKRDEYLAQGNAAQAERYENKLREFQATRKWVADDVCELKEDRSVVPKQAPAPAAAAAAAAPAAVVVGPVNPDQEFYETYDAFVSQHEATLRKFASIDNNREASQEFLEQHGEILHQHADGFLLLLCLDVAMRNVAKGAACTAKDKRELRRTVQQHLLLNYILELAKLSKLEDARAGVRPFFAKTRNQTKEQLQEFENELTAFITRIEKRAEEKLSRGESSPLQRNKAKKEEEEEEYEKAELGPGGLDPTEVLQSLPKDMQDAFVEQDVPKLKAILSEMDSKEANYHLKRCIDAGLWVVPPKREGEEEEYEDSEAEEE